MKDFGRWGRPTMADTPEVPPLPTPRAHLFEFASPFGGIHQSLSSNAWNGSRPQSSVPVYDGFQLLAYGDALTKAAAARIGELEAENAKLRDVMSTWRAEGGRISELEAERDALAAEVERLKEEPLLHTDHTDCLPDGHPLARESVHCDACGAMVHAFNNECMQGWVEMAGRGNFCLRCFTAAGCYPWPKDE